MDYAVFSGSHYEIGVQKGRCFREGTVGRVESMLEMFERDWGGTPEALAPIHDRLRANGERAYPELIEQMDGIADGAGLPREQILIVNHYAYLWGVLNPRPAAECSAIAFAGGPDGPVLGQNLDIGGGDWYACELTRPTDGYAVLSDSWYAMAWADCGINEHGLAIGSSHLGCTQYIEDWETAVNVHFFTRLMLRHARNVPEAIEYMRQIPLMIPLNHGKNYVLADAEGRLAVIERTQGTVAVREDDCGAMAVTNFCLAPEMAALVDASTQERRDLNTNAEERYVRMMGIYDEAGRQGSLALMERVMRCHDAPGVICRHPETDPGGLSRLSMIALPAARKLLISDGPPCMNPYREHGFER